MDAALAFGDRHALHAVSAGFVAQPAVDAGAGDLHDDFAVAAQFGFAGRQDLGLPAALFGVAQVHAQQVAGKERTLVAAGAGADFDDGVAGVVGVAWQQQVFDAGFGFLQAGFGVSGFFVGKVAQLGVVAHLAGGLQVGVCLLPAGIVVQHFADFGVFVVQFPEQGDVTADVFAGQLGVEFVQPVLQAVQLGPQGVFHGDAPKIVAIILPMAVKPAKHVARPCRWHRVGGLGRWRDVLSSRSGRGMLRRQTGRQADRQTVPFSVARRVGPGTAPSAGWPVRRSGRRGATAGWWGRA